MTRKLKLGWNVPDVPVKDKWYGFEINRTVTTDGDYLIRWMAREDPHGGNPYIVDTYLTYTGDNRSDTWKHYHSATKKEIENHLENSDLYPMDWALVSHD